MKAKKLPQKRSKPVKTRATVKKSGDVKWTPLQVVRLSIDHAITLRRAKDRDTYHRLKEGLDEYGCDSVTTFRILDAATTNSGNDLAFELANPAMAVIDAISQMSNRAQAIAEVLKGDGWQKAAARVSEQVHLALARILRALTPRVRAAAFDTKNEELLFEVLQILIGDGHDAANLIKRYQELFADKDRNEDGTIQSDSFPDHFAWDAYLRVAALEKLVDIFPKHIRTAARQMNAWPMLWYCHNDRKKKFEQIANMLELGADYPLDVRKGLSWRPDTPIIQYLDNLVNRFQSFGRDFMAVKEWESDEIKAAERAASEPWEDHPSKAAVQALRESTSLPKLTKATAKSWANGAIIPYIMASDAKTPGSCSEPALQSIWKQKGVKSEATFKSRLAPLVVRTLISISRA